jgi:hypothetical protein
LRRELVRGFGTSPHIDEALKAPAKSGAAPLVARKNLAAGLAIPAAEFISEHGACIACIARNFKPAAVNTNTNHGGANASSNFIGI